MTTKRPTILIYSVNVDDSLMIREICAGIEEEGLLYEVQPFYYGVLNDLSYKAANESSLGSGIGIVGTKVAMQIRTMPEGKNIFFIDKPSFSQCRKIGSNAARAVKKTPFHNLED